MLIKKYLNSGTISQADDKYYEGTGWRFVPGNLLKQSDPNYQVALRKGLDKNYLVNENGSLVPEKTRSAYVQNKEYLAQLPYQEQNDINDARQMYIRQGDRFIASEYNTSHMLNTMLLKPLEISIPSKIFGALTTNQADNFGDRFRYVFNPSNRGFFELNNYTRRAYDKDPVRATILNLAGDFIIPTALVKGTQVIASSRPVITRRLVNKLNLDIKDTLFFNVPVYHGTTYTGDTFLPYQETLIPETNVIKASGDAGIHVADSSIPGTIRLRNRAKYVAGTPVKDGMPVNAHIREGIYTYTDKTLPIEVNDLGTFDLEMITPLTQYNPILRQRLAKVPYKSELNKYHHEYGTVYKDNPNLINRSVRTSENQLRFNKELEASARLWNRFGINFKYKNIYEKAKGLSYAINDPEFSLLLSKYRPSPNYNNPYNANYIDVLEWLSFQQ